MGYLETLRRATSVRSDPATAATTGCSARINSAVAAGIEKPLVCDQVIFTSTRTPTGEGYRVIAASKKVRTDEKQTITRLSPSHDSLCDEGAPDLENERPLGLICAAALYALPSSRLCLAASMLAGDEQTGRGGKRIYTLNLIFSPDDWAGFGFNPFAILRALARSEHVTPQLKPPSTLPSIILAPTGSDFVAGGAGVVFSGITPNARRQILVEVLLQNDCLVPISKSWLECAEGVLLGAPAPLRAKISFSAGLRFCTTRHHRLEILALDTTAKARLASSNVHCIDPTTNASTAGNLWTEFVERHWNRGDLEGLARRTSRPFSSCALDSLNRIASLYNQIDQLDSLSTERMLANATEMLDPVSDRVESEIRMELTDKARNLLRARVQQLRVEEFDAVWSRMLGMVRIASARASFAGPLIEPALRGLAARDPLAGVKQALEVCQIPSSASLLTPSFQDYVFDKFAEYWSHIDHVKRDKAARSLRSSLQRTTHPLAARVAALVAFPQPAK
ncbi:MAG: hypothetical protein HY287_05315 [Planctomycetes bacterium]|nr:hypothetical protein [Planctomycetota bacterium]MBI3833729.1 hypothetical protein [Planctomycetota bacterium]